MKTDLEHIHFSLRITTNTINILHAVERYFDGTAKYVKEKGAEFMNGMNCYHPKAYLYAVSWSCGGSCQYIGVEVAISVLMKVPYYLEFLIWKMRCVHGYGILERNLFMLLQSLEMIDYCVSYQYYTFQCACPSDSLLETAATCVNTNLE